MNTIILTLLTSFLFFQISYCKPLDRKAIGTIYIIENDICAYLEPSKRSACSLSLKKFDKLNLLEKRIPDKINAEGFKWNKVYLDGIEYYLPVDDEFRIFSYVTMIPNSMPFQMKVKASQLRLRNLPSINSEILTLIPNGSIVTVHGLSGSKYTIDGITEAWAHIISNDKEGFVFYGYLEPNTALNNEFSDESDDDSIKTEGFIVFKKDQPNAYLDPNESKGYSVKLYCSEGKGNIVEGISFPTSLGKYHYATKFKLIKGIKYYFVNKRVVFKNDGESGNTCYSAWFSEMEVNHFQMPFLDWYKEKFKDKISEKFSKFVNAENLDLERTTLEPLTLVEKSNKKIYLAKIYKFTEDLTSELDSIQLLEETENSFFNLLGEHKFENFEFKDLNSDGINEIIGKNDFRGNYTWEYFEILNGKLSKFLTIDFSEYESEDEKCKFKLNLNGVEKKISVKVDDSREWDKICKIYIKDNLIGIYDTKGFYKLYNGSLTIAK